MELLLLQKNTYVNFIKLIKHIKLFADDSIQIKIASEVLSFSATKNGSSDR